MKKYYLFLFIIFFLLISCPGEEAFICIILEPLSNSTKSVEILNLSKKHSIEMRAEYISHYKWTDIAVYPIESDNEVVIDIIFTISGNLKCNLEDAAEIIIYESEKQVKKYKIKPGKIYIKKKIDWWGPMIKIEYRPNNKINNSIKRGKIKIKCKFIKTWV